MICCMGNAFKTTNQWGIVFGQDLAYTPEQFSLLKRLLIMI